MAKMIDKAAKNDLTPEEDEVLDTIFTIPNLISTIRLCMVPCFIVLLLTGYDILATILFAVAAGTDWIDGQIARRTHTVSKLGRLLDPAVDRILMISGVVCLLAVGRLPLWVVVLVLGRDLLLLICGAYLLKKWRIRVAVIYPGKVATTFLFVGFAALLLNWPVLVGMGVVPFSWLPGFSSDPTRGVSGSSTQALSSARSPQSITSQRGRSSYLLRSVKCVPNNALRRRKSSFAALFL